jgi:hypothetical protein
VALALPGSGDKRRYSACPLSAAEPADAVMCYPSWSLWRDAGSNQEEVSALGTSEFIKNKYFLFYQMVVESLSLGFFNLLVTDWNMSIQVG